MSKVTIFLPSYNLKPGDISGCICFTAFNTHIIPQRRFELSCSQAVSCMTGKSSVQSLYTSCTGHEIRVVQAVTSRTRRPSTNELRELLFPVHNCPRLARRIQFLMVASPRKHARDRSAGLCGQQSPVKWLD